MFSADVIAHLSHAHKIPSDQKRDLFHGLDKISENEGRIYKKIDSKGREKFFKAKDFWSSIYHIIFSTRMSELDLLYLGARVSEQLTNSNDLKLNAKVTATFVNVLRKVNTNTTWFFPREQAFDYLLSQPRLQYIENAAKKIVNGTPISVEELLLVQELSKIPESFLDQNFDFNDYVSTCLRSINDYYNPIFTSLRGINQDREIAKYNYQAYLINNLRIMKPSLVRSSSALSDVQINQIRNAEQVLANLQRTYSRLDLQSFQHLEGLKNIFEICTYSQFIPEDSSSSSSSTDSDSDSDIQSINSISQPKFKDIDDRLRSLLKRVPNCNDLDSSTINYELGKLKPNKKRDYEKWLTKNIAKLPAYFKPKNLNKLLACLKAERSKELLRIKHDIAESEVSPISYTDWEDIPPSYLYIPKDTTVHFFDLSPGKESDLSVFQKVFEGNWKSPVTTVRFPLDAWFAFISICRQNNIVEVNPLDHLKTAFKTMKEANIEELKSRNVHTKDDEAYTVKDWNSFLTLCNNNDIEIFGNKLETIFTSIVMEKLIHDIIAEERKEFDFNLIEPYLDVLNSSVVQQSPLPDVYGMKVSEELNHILNENMHKGAFYLWNSLKDQKIIISAPSEKMIKSAKALNIDLRN
ncbi:MAG: hypothetical protein H0T62_06035 [Parachlamydiaceae bacterium]|nr:hypothetical protein [Parachlamydiaceae bacterium]